MSILAFVVVFAIGPADYQENMTVARQWPVAPATAFVERANGKRLIELEAELAK